MVIFNLEWDVTVFYKITTVEEWQSALTRGMFEGSKLDLKDGYIHLSTAGQVLDTARLHFSGQENLVLVALTESSVAPALKWEASRGGQLFPHVYATLKTAQVLWVEPLKWNGSAHEFPKAFLK
jgi:uncharacterized protein (DUF952 family)